MSACPTCSAQNPAGARFCAQCGTGLAPEPAPVAEAAQSEADETRKTVTVLFADVVGSTAVGDSLDPETLRHIMSRHFDEIRRIVEAHGGVVEKFIGDAAMAVFGIPRVHEDDALRAVRAAVAVRDRLTELDGELRERLGTPIAWRIGVNTGEVVAGAAGSGQRFVSGDAVNVAKRLEEAAGTGEVVIGDATYRLVRDAVSVEPLEGVVLKGKQESVRAHRLLAVGSGQDGTQRRADAPMVGRHRQRQLLTDGLAQVAADRVCLLFTIVGSAGVGKSRLVNEFLAGLDADVRLLRGRCLSYGQGITFWPIREMVHQAAGIGDQDSAAEAREKISALVDPSTPDAQRTVEGVTDVIGLGDGGVERQDAFLAVRGLFEGIAQQRPLVLLFDDVHWAEASLLDLIEHIADWSRDAPILLLCVGRHDLLEVRPGWGGGKLASTTIQLEPLTAGESDELLAGLLGEAELEPDVRRRIAESADGNPLFVEELLGMLIDDGSLVRRDGRWVAARDLRLLTVPPTIQALLAARLDRLDRTERSVIECGSVEGKVFHASAVAALVPDPIRAMVPSNLLALMRKELLRPDRAAFSGDEAYRFRHLLIRDAAYDAMPKQARAEMHVRFADWLAAAAGERRPEYEEILGHHLDQAVRYRRELALGDADADELADRAAAYLGQAGMRADDRGDLNAATPLLERALELTADEALRPRLREHLADAWYGRMQPLVAKSHLEQAIAEFQAVGDAAGAARAEVLLLAVRSSLESLEMTEVLPRARELAAELDALGDLKGWASAMELVGSHLFFLGRVTEAIEVITDGVARAPQHSRERTLMAHWLAACHYWGSTPVDDAIRRTEEILRDHAGSRSVESGALRVLGSLKGMLGDFETARTDIARADLLAREIGYDQLAGSSGAHFLGPVELLAGNPQAALDAALPSYEEMSASGDLAFSSTAAGNVAAAYAELREWDEAERYARIAIDTAATSDVESQALGRRALAVVLANRGELLEAERLARESVAIRDATEYLEGAAHSYLALGEVLRLAGRHDEADEALRGALDRFERKGNVVMVDRVRRNLEDGSRSSGA